MQHVFDARLNNTAKIITVLVLLLSLPIPLVFYKAGLHSQMPLLFSFLFAIYLLAFLLHPFQYVVEEQTLLIRKYILPKKLYLNQIATVDAVNYADLKIRLRLFGSGGLWGWFGIFYSAKYKRVNMQCSQTENLVLITTKDGQKIVLSPSDRNLFLATLITSIHNAQKYASSSSLKH